MSLCDEIPLQNRLRLNVQQSSIFATIDRVI